MIKRSVVERKNIYAGLLVKATPVKLETFSSFKDQKDIYIVEEKDIYLRKEVLRGLIYRIDKDGNAENLLYKPINRPRIIKSSSLSGIVLPKEEMVVTDSIALNPLLNALKYGKYLYPNELKEIEKIMFNNGIFLSKSEKALDVILDMIDSELERTRALGTAYQDSLNKFFGIHTYPTVKEPNYELIKRRTDFK